MKDIELTSHRPSTGSVVRLKIPYKILKQALKLEDGLAGTVDILAYIMENSPSDRYSDWELDMRPLLNIETFRPHILDLMSSGKEWKEEWEDE